MATSPPRYIKAVSQGPSAGGGHAWVRGLPWSLPRNTIIDTSVPAEEGGEALNGFLGHLGSDFFEVLEEDGSILCVGVVFNITSGTFQTIGTGDEEEAAVPEIKFQVSRVFEDATETQSKLSVTFDTFVDPQGHRLETPVLLTPGKYRSDCWVTLSETYEYSEVPEVRFTLVPLKLEPKYLTIDDVKCVGLSTYTDYDLENGELVKTTYEFPGEGDPPLAIDMRTSTKTSVDWVAYLFGRGVNLKDVNTIPGLRSWLTSKGHIEANWSSPGAALAGYATGGAFMEQKTIAAAIGRYLFEHGAALDWTSPQARIIVVPRTKPVAPRTITMDDIARKSEDDPSPQIVVRYSDENEVVNEIKSRFLRDYSVGTAFDAFLEPVYARRNTSSINALGSRMNDPRFWYDWLRDLGDAVETTDLWLAHFGTPKLLVEFVGYLNLLDVQRGDYMKFDLTPTITIGETVGTPDENQGWGEGGWGGAGWGGTQISPIGTIKGEKFKPLTPSSGYVFMVDSPIQVDWNAKRVLVSLREVP